jgi:hypothetical protein
MAYGQKSIFEFHLWHLSSDFSICPEKGYSFHADRYMRERNIINHWINIQGKKKKSKNEIN